MRNKEPLAFLNTVKFLLCYTLWQILTFYSNTYKAEHKVSGKGKVVRKII